MAVPAAAASVDGRAPSVSRKVTTVTPVAVRMATHVGSQPARINGMTSLITTARVRASAINDRTPRHPPTTTTAAANSPSNNESVGTR